jgi:hypothetical protein
MAAKGSTYIPLSLRSRRLRTWASAPPAGSSSLRRRTTWCARSLGVNSSPSRTKQPLMTGPTRVPSCSRLPTRRASASTPSRSSSWGVPRARPWGYLIDDADGHSAVVGGNLSRSFHVELEQCQGARCCCSTATRMLTGRSWTCMCTLNSRAVGVVAAEGLEGEQLQQEFPPFYTGRRAVLYPQKAAFCASRGWRDWGSKHWDCQSHKMEESFWRLCS